MSLGAIRHIKYSGIRKKRFPVIILQVFLLWLCLTQASGQQSNTLFLLHSIPQTNQINPAVQAGCKLFVGFPFLSTVHLDYSNSSFTYNELTADNIIQLDQVYEKLHRMNMVTGELASYPISLGYKFSNNYFTFSIADRFNTYGSFSKKLAGLVLYGNAPFVGDVQRFNNTRANATYYREFAAGWAFDWDRFTSIGFKAKLLFGKANLNTGASRVLFGTNAETYALTVDGNVGINSSYGFMDLDVNPADSSISYLDVRRPNGLSILFNPRNVGLAADFGVINKFSDEFTLSASLLDLGMIFWTDDLYNVGAEVDFLYEGVLEGTDFSTAAYFRDLTDSIASDVIYEVTNHPYISPLPAQLYLGAEYNWKENVTLGGVMRTVLVNRRIKSSLTASVNAMLFKRVQTSLSWTYMNNSIKNVGAGLAYTGGGFQFYAVSDNIIGLIQPFDSRSVNLRFGMNLMLGCPKNYNKVREQDYSMLPCPPNQRLWQKKKKRRK